MSKWQHLFVSLTATLLFSGVQISIAHADCGDGFVEPTEECDDGDNLDGDGCDQNCNEEPGFICNNADFSLVVSESFENDSSDDGPEPNWVLSNNDLTVTQTLNARPSVYQTNIPANVAPITFNVEVETTNDDDFIGFVIGYQSGENTASDADFLLLDWKQTFQDNSGPGGLGVAEEGLALSRVTGAAAFTELWQHSGDVTELARGTNFGDTGWADNTEYEVRIDFSTDQIRVFVDDVLEIDYTPAPGEQLPNGTFGFYTASQVDARFTLESPVFASICREIVCGDGINDPSEVCDEGDAVNGTTDCGCQSDCTLPDTSTTCDTNDTFCDGDGTCDGAGTCVADGEPACTGTLLCDEINDQCVACLGDSDCGDGNFCNGTETCELGVCVSPGDPCGGNTPVCDEGNDQCVGCLDASDCDDGTFCNGAETCDAGTCVSATNPCDGDNPLCDEDNNQCVACFDASDCDDGSFCNGAETCDAGTCVSATNPCDDDNPFCDEDADICVECQSDSDCPNENEICAPATSTCELDPEVACTTALDCNGTEVCETATGNCIPECEQDTDCPGSAPTCDPETNTCVPECLVDSDCPGTTVCTNTDNGNDGDNTCAAECQVDEDCAAPDSCNVLGQCAPACNDDLDCPGTDVCVDGDTATRTQCAPECASNDDCDTGEACSATTNTCEPECTADEGCDSGACDEDSGSCELGCTADADCPPAYSCDTDIGFCTPAGCANNADCRGDEVCDARTLTCTTGCSTDADCDGALSCNTTSGTCEPGCVLNMDCEEGTYCSRASLTCETQCTADADCEGTEVCDTDSGACVPECTVNADCESGEVCESQTLTCVTPCSEDSECNEDIGEECNLKSETCIATCSGSADCTGVVNAFCERNRDDSRLCVPDCIGDPTCRAPFCTRVSDDSDDTNDLVCEPCTEDGDCDAGEVCDADSGACTPGCLVSDACEANEVCDRDLTCKQAGCSSDEDCSGETPVCDLTDGVCQECLLDSQCTDETPFCVEEEGAFNCEECVEDTDCSDDGQFCTGEAVCNGFECSFTGNPCDSNEECDEEADECVEPAPTPECGDGTVDEGEECDDGNTDSGDGCSSTCTVETDEPGPVDPGNGGGEGLSATGGNAIDCSSTGTGHAPLGGTALILFGLLAIRRKNRAE